MTSQMPSAQRTRKLPRVVIVLAIISTIAAIASFAVACSFFIAVTSGLEGPFRLRLFWMPMPWWIYRVMIVVAISNMIWLFVFCFSRFSKVRIRQQPSRKKTIVCWSPTRWQLIWLLLIGSLPSQSLYLVHSHEAFVSSGKTELINVAMVTPDDGWAVGNFQADPPDGSSYGVIWQYHNGIWKQVVQLANTYLFGVTALPDGEAWAVGGGHTILHEQTGVWTLVSSDDSSLDDFASVAMVSSTEGWAVGGSSTSKGSRGFIWHYSHGKWAEAFQVEKSYLLDISVLPDGEAWAVGNGGIILHEQQGRWSQVTSPTQQVLWGISMISPTEGWATGAQLLHFHNGTWTFFSQSTLLYQPLSIAMITTDEGWAIGAGGRVLHYSQGSWQVAYTTANLHLDNIALVAGTASEGWIVGDGAVTGTKTGTIPPPTILHMHNGNWHTFPS